MTPAIDPDPSRGLIAHLLESATSLFGERRHPADTLRSLDARTLADIGIAQIGQGPDSLHVAMTDTTRHDVTKPAGVPSTR